MQATIDQLQTIIADAVQIGYMEAIKAYEPVADDLKEKDIEVWCSATFSSRARIKRLIRMGVIKPHRRGEHKNCALYYSKADIKKALLAQRLSALVTCDKLAGKESR